MVDGAPDPIRFAELIGGLIAQATNGSAASANLRRDGRTAGHRRESRRRNPLEALWNDLQATYPFSLLCAYPMHRLGLEDFTPLIGEVCAEHSRVIPAESYTSLVVPDDRLREIAALQQKAQWLEAEIAVRKQIEEQLRRSQQRPRGFRRAGAVGLHWVGPDGRSSGRTRRSCDLLGYTREEYVGRNIAEFHADPRRSRISSAA